MICIVVNDKNDHPRAQKSILIKCMKGLGTKIFKAFFFMLTYRDFMPIFVHTRSFKVTFTKRTRLFFTTKKNTRKGDGPGPQGLLPLWLGVAIPSSEANNREFKQGRRLRLRLRLEARILLVKRGKIHVLHVQHEFPCISRPYSTKQQREITKF